MNKVPEATMSEDFQLDIPLETSHEYQNFRLLEIPSELLGLITSKTPPRYPFFLDVIYILSEPKLINGGSSF